MASSSVADRNRQRSQLDLLPRGRRLLFDVHHTLHRGAQLLEWKGDHPSRGWSLAGEDLAIDTSRLKFGRKHADPRLVEVNLARGYLMDNLVTNRAIVSLLGGRRHRFATTAPQEQSGDETYQAKSFHP